MVPWQMAFDPQNACHTMICLSRFITATCLNILVCARVSVYTCVCTCVRVKKQRRTERKHGEEVTDRKGGREKSGEYEREKLS